MTSKPAFLVVSSAPDKRKSSRSLQLVVDRLRRDGHPTQLWCLRGPAEGTQAAELVPDRVVDDLRLRPVPRLLDQIGLGIVASRLRGLTLRWWLRNLDPDVVVLDDGVGERVLTGRWRTATRRVARVNRLPPSTTEQEEPPTRPPDLTLTPPGADLVGMVNQLVTPEVDDYDDAVLASRRREVTRAALGIPHHEPLVVGWGSDSWVDGPELFIRSLWALGHRHSILAHGLWLGLDSDPAEIGQLEDEATRCGLGGRYHHAAENTLANRLCGDVVFLPHRSPPTDDDRPDAAEMVLDAIVSGLRVVAFPDVADPDPEVIEVAYLDLEASAGALADGLTGDRDDRSRDALDRLGVDAWVSRFLVAVEEIC